MKREKNASGAQKKELPHIFVILLVVIILATICTWIIPAGAYDRVMDEASGKMLIDPDSFHYIEKTPVGPFGMFVGIEEGLIEAANITFLILCAFSSLYLLEKTGAIDAAIALMVRKTEKHPKYSKVIKANGYGDPRGVGLHRNHVLRRNYRIYSDLCRRCHGFGI